MSTYTYSPAVSRLKRLGKDYLACAEEARELGAKAEREGRDFTPAEAARAERLVATSRQLKAQIDREKEDHAMKSAIGDLGGAIGHYDDGQPGVGIDGRPRRGPVTGRPWAKSVADAMGRTATATGVKALTTGSIDVPIPVETEVVAWPQQPRRITDLLVDRAPLTANTFSFLRQVAREHNAAAVPDGASKPTSRYTTTEIEDRARVFATLAEPFPERFLADYPALTAWLESELEASVLAAVEEGVIAGDGTGENVTGILHASGTVAVDAAPGGPLVTMRKARTELELIGEQPTAWVLNPRDAESIDLAREDGATGAFLVGGASPAGDNIFGNLPRVASPVVPAGTAILADWSQVRLLVREELRLDADRSGELFTKNQVVMRSEGRFGVAVLRPQAFAVIDLTA